jgi:hypothetical protein
MPWIPELFSAPVLERFLSRASGAHSAIPYFQGLLTGETEALVRSFAGEPELHHPYRGRIKGRRAFERYVVETNAWLAALNCTIDDFNRVITPARGVEEALVTLEVDGRHVEWPVAIVAERDQDAHIVELRLYYSTWVLLGAHANRPPVLQPDPDAHAPDVVGEYQRALAAGDAEAAVAAFEPDGYVREPAGGVHRGADELRALYERFFSTGGGIPLEHCAVTVNDRACVLEYNAVSWGRTELRPQAGLAVYVRGATGKLAAARIYDDVDPPLRLP